jgi:hypothetical protein
MSHIARQHLQQAVKAYLEEDGASDMGAYRDAVTDILHLAKKDRRVFRSKAIGGSLDMLNHWITQSAFDGFQEELETAEVRKVRRIPQKKLALHLNDKFEFDGAIREFEERLKGEEPNAQVQG